MKFFSLLHTFLAKVPEISPELVHRHRWWLSSDQRSRGTLFSNVGNIPVALQILINVPMVSYKTLHHSLFPPLCKFCIRKWMWNKNAWKHIKMKKTGLKNLKKYFLLCTLWRLWNDQLNHQIRATRFQPSHVLGFAWHSLSSSLGFWR